MVPDGGGIRRGRPPMLGSSLRRAAGASAATPQPAHNRPVVSRPAPAPHTTPKITPVAAGAKKRVLFLCIGNSCRSQMAEGFAKTYGSDVMEIHSAGLAPAPLIAPMTKYIMSLRGVALEGQFPKGLETVLRHPFDIIVNMTGQPINIPGAVLLDWPVRDPIGLQEPVYRAVAAQIEDLVMRLVLQVRGDQEMSANRR